MSSGIVGRFLRGLAPEFASGTRPAMDPVTARRARDQNRERQNVSAKTQPKLAWHFCATAGGKPILRDGWTPPPVGEWLKHTGPVEICKSGLHASLRPIDALGYAPGAWATLVEVDQIEAQQEDKLVCRRRKVIWGADIRSPLVEFAAWCAKRAKKHAANAAANAAAARAANAAAARAVYASYAANAAVGGSGRKKERAAQNRKLIQLLRAAGAPI